MLTHACVIVYRKKVCCKRVIVFVDTGRVRLLDFGAAIQNLKYIIIIEYIQRGKVPLINVFSYNK